jgi:hypothetical protein
MAIPGEAEADCIFTAGLASITPVLWPESTLSSPSRSPLHYYSLIHYFISRTHEMK